MNMVQSLSYDYFNSFFGGALFQKDGQVLRVVEAGTRTVACANVSTGGEERIPNDFFTGFKTFAYPVLGYRKVRDCTAFITRRQSTARGLRSNGMTIDVTPATMALAEHGLVSIRFGEHERAIAAFSENFDTLSDLPRLLRGEVSSLVLSPYFVIEPAVDSEDSWYSILYKQAQVGSINDRGVITLNNPIYGKMIGVNTNEQ